MPAHLKRGIYSYQEPTCVTKFIPSTILHALEDNLVRLDSTISITIVTPIFKPWGELHLRKKVT